MASSLLHGAVKLELGVGFEAHGETYTIHEGLHYIYESVGCSSLRIAGSLELAETQTEDIIVTLECKHLMEDDATNSEPMLSLAMRPSTAKGLRVSFYANTANGVKISLAHHERVLSSACYYLQDYQIICLHLPDRNPLYPTFKTNFDDVQVRKVQTIIPSSDANRHGPTQIVSQPPKNVSFIKETPTASRYVDKLDLEYDLRDETELSPAGSPAVAAAVGADMPVRKSDDTEASETPAMPGTHIELISRGHLSRKSESLGKGLPSLPAEFSASFDPTITLKDANVDNVQATFVSKKRKASADNYKPSSKRRIQTLRNEDKKEAVNTKGALSRLSNDRKDDASPPTPVVDASDGFASQSIGDNPDRVTSPSLTRTRGRPRKVIAAESKPDDGRKDITRSLASPRRSQRSESKQITVAFSNSTIQLPSSKKFQYGQVRMAEHVDTETNVLCIGQGRLATTSKVLKAIILGIPILSDTWMEESLKAQRVLDFDQFYASNALVDKRWRLARGWCRGEAKPDKQQLMQHTLYLTPMLCKSYGATGFDAVKELGELLGFKNTTSYPSISFDEKKDKVVALGLSDDTDEDAEQLLRRGIKVYRKDLLKATIFAGSLQLDNKFLIKEVHSARQKTQKRKKYMAKDS